MALSTVGRWIKVAIANIIYQFPDSGGLPTRQLYSISRLQSENGRFRDEGANAGESEGKSDQI